jgi:iduronate 2-sulfatase
MVTDRYHYVEWYRWDHATKTAGELAAVELYDNQLDPGENNNIAELAENAEVVRQLARQLKAGWKAARLK